jgi:pimeloyl-ACP methyl ester carboxylesterase
MAKLHACRVQGLDDSVLCGRFEVPEDRARPEGRKLSLNIVVVPATGDSVASDPLVFLAGGGVAPATRYAGFLSRAFPALRRTRDILLVDQRGTWNSGALPCDVGVPQDTAAAMAALRRCRDSLATKADLRFYTTPIAMDDLDAVRAWLGYTKLNLYGVSYGTKAAQVYMRQYPDRVRAAVLYGVVPVSAPTQLDLAASSQASLRLVFRACDDDSACHAAFPQPAAELDSVLARLEAAPVRIPVDGSRTDNAVVIQEVTARTARDLFQGMLGSARAIERLPWIIHSAYTGDLKPIAQAIFGDLGPPPPPRGVFLCILCSEAMSQVDAAAVEPATRGSFFGDFPVRWQLRQCSEWPRGPLPKGFWQPVSANVPVLAISGDLDPITPPRYGSSVARAMHGTHIMVPNRSHNDVDPCITGMFERFLIAGTAEGLDASCASQPRPLRFATSAGAPTGR